MTKANFIVVLKICLLEKPMYIGAYKTIVVNVLKNRELNSVMTIRFKCYF